MSESWLNPAWRPAASSRATVVCVHGAVVHGWEMVLLRQRLRQAGYRVRQFQYASMLRGLDDNIGRLKAFLSATKGDTLHVVGHSMGGVLTRLLFERDPDPRPGRLVAMGSPLLSCWVGQRILDQHPRLGPVMVGRTVRDYVARAPDPVWHGKRDLGVIAGTYAIGIGASLPGHPLPSDGVIHLEETKIAGLQGHISYRLNHFSLLVSRRCCTQTVRFLATGTFGAVADPPGLK